MKTRLLFVFILTLASSGLMAQSGEMRGYYQTVQSFNFAAAGAGSQSSTISGDAFHGGGFGFVIDISDAFSLYTDSTFLSGVDNGVIRLRLFNQVQGFRVTAREVGPVNFYAKAGAGFARWEVTVLGGSGSTYKMSLEYGGGIDVPVTENFFIFGEFKGTTFSLPQLSASPDRQKWQTSPTIMTGVGIRF